MVPKCRVTHIDVGVESDGAQEGASWVADDHNYHPDVLRRRCGNIEGAKWFRASSPVPVVIMEVTEGK